MKVKWKPPNTTKCFEIWQLLTLSFPPNKVWCKIIIRNEWHKWKHVTKSGIKRCAVIKREVIAYIWHLVTMRNFFAPKNLNDLWNLDNRKKCIRRNLKICYNHKSIFESMTFYWMAFKQFILIAIVCCNICKETM